ncbi:MAG: hypothetical protein ABIR33_02795 [Pyrinomonadaceae bacterium]
MIFRKLVSFVMVVLILNAASSLTVLAAIPQDDKEAKAAKKVKSKVAKIGVGTEVKVEVKLKNGEKVKGSITEIKSDSFTVIDETTNSPSVITYAQVNQVKKKNSTKGLAIVGIIVGVVSVVALVAAGRNAQ